MVSAGTGHTTDGHAGKTVTFIKVNLNFFKVIHKGAGSGGKGLMHKCEDLSLDPHSLFIKLSVVANNGLCL